MICRIVLRRRSHTDPPGTRGVSFRRGKLAEWVARNPTLLRDEPGIITDTRQLKIGDGRTPWIDLPYATAEEALALFLRAGSRT